VTLQLCTVTDKSCQLSIACSSLDLGPQRKTTKTKVKKTLVKAKFVISSMNYKLIISSGRSVILQIIVYGKITIMYNYV